jgi:hypothetical protein
MVKRMKTAPSIAQRIGSRVRAKGRGHVHVPADFLDLGSRAAVDQALSRLARAGHLRRLARGLYDFPKTHHAFGVLPPVLHRVAEAIARSTGSRLQVSGAQAANALGLSTQVPAQLLYWTDGPSRTVRVGNRRIQFRHGAPRRLAGAGTAAGAVVQALRYLGPSGVTDEAVDRVRRALSPSDRAALRRHAAEAPAWLRPALLQISAARSAAWTRSPAGRDRSA